MKTAIVYASVHHGNTEKVVKAISEKHPEVELIDATKTILGFVHRYGSSRHSGCSVSLNTFLYFSLAPGMPLNLRAIVSA